MVLKMSRPQKHPITGIYQFRKRVPLQIRALVGKTEEKISLGTRDPSEAKLYHARIAAEVETRWRQLAEGTITLTQKQAVAISGEIYREIVAETEDNPGESFPWKARLQSRLAKPKRGNLPERDEETSMKVLQTIKERANDRPIRRFLAARGMLLDDASMSLVRKEVHRSVVQALEHVIRLAEGDYRPDPNASRFPDFSMSESELKKPADAQGKFQLTAVFEAYAKEKGIATTSHKKWKLIIEKVGKEIPDIRDLTREWIVDWKDRLVASGLAQKSVKESYLACLRAVCGWGVANGRIKENPVTGITVYVPRKVKTREKFFTSTEAKAVLRATFQAPPARMSEGMKDARRWVPWLCAYTGARVGEISQLRKQDIEQHEEHWLIWITPEAGSTKDANPRHVAIHPHLIEQGFLKFVKSKRAGPLFYDPALGRGGKSKNMQHNKVGEKICSWVRSIGITDRRIRPNHAWRHLFKTLSRSARVDPGARDYMMGHVPHNEGEAYGAFLSDALVHEIRKIPYFNLEK